MENKLMKEEKEEKTIGYYLNQENGKGKKKEEKKEEKKEKTIGYYLNKITQVVQKERSKKSTSENYSMFPIKDEESYKYFKLQEAILWQSNEMDFSRDKKDYIASSPEEKRLLNMILGFFSSGDGIVSQNILLRFLLECKTYEETSMFITQLYIELVHAETYGLIIATMIPNEIKRNEVFDMCNNLECVKAKTEWMEKYMYSDCSRAERLIAFAIAEGLFFSVLFAIIFWFRKRGRFASFIFANEQISKDEALHRNFGCALFKRESLNNPKYQKIALEMLESALEIEFKFIETMIPDPIQELNSTDLKQYCKMVVDSLLVQLGFEPKYGVELPHSMEWMGDISATQKSNFFEVTVGSYNQFNVTDLIEKRKKLGIDTSDDMIVDPLSRPEDIDF